MLAQDWINFLTIVVLLLLIVAIVYLIVFLHRSNRIIGRIDNLSGTLREFASSLVPAVINIGTVVAAVEGLLQKYVLHQTKSKNKKA